MPSGTRVIGSNPIQVKTYVKEDSEFVLIGDRKANGVISETNISTYNNERYYVHLPMMRRPVDGEDVYTLENILDNIWIYGKVSISENRVIPQKHTNKTLALDQEKLVSVKSGLRVTKGPDASFWKNSSRGGRKHVNKKRPTRKKLVNLVERF